MQKITKTFQYGDHQVTLETGQIARQAGGAVKVSMGDTVVHALDGVDLHIDAGEFVSVIGSSGSGNRIRYSLQQRPGGLLPIPSFPNCPYFDFSWNIVCSRNCWLLYKIHENSNR